MSVIAVSDFSSLNFRTDWKLDFQKNECYEQKFLTIDEIRVQYLIPESSTLKLFLQNLYSGEVKAIDTEDLLLSDNFYIREFVIPPIDVTGDTMFSVYFAETEIGNKDCETYFQVCMELKNTVLLKYTHRRDEFGTIFSLDHPFFFRVEGVFLPQEVAFENESEDFRDQRYTARMLSDYTYEKRTLTIGGGFGVPNWAARKINLIFSLSNVQVDGVYMVRSDGSSVQITLLHNDYPLYIYKIELEESYDDPNNMDISDIAFARVIDPKKKIKRKSGENQIRVYNDFCFAANSASDTAKMIRELETINELAEHFTIEIDDTTSDSSKKATLKLLKTFIFEGYIDQPIRKSDDVEFNSVTSPLFIFNELITPDFVSGLLGTGARLKDNHLELDEITVRKRMNVFELLIQRVRAVGGQLLLSPASIKISSVEELEDGYKCSFNTDNQTTIPEPFVVDDQGFHETFTGQGINRYWRLVTEVGADYFVLSKTDREEGSGVPQPEDEIILLGNRTDKARQSAMILNSYGNDAPYLDTYDGINSYDLSNKLLTREGNLNGIVDEVFGQLTGSGLYAKNVYLRGKFALSTGQDVESKFGETDATLGNMQGQLNTQGGVITDLQANVSAIPGQIEQSVSGVIDWTKEEIADKIAKTVMVTAQSQVFKYAAGYTGTPTPASILLTATAKNFTPVTYQWQYLDSLTWKDISGATGTTYSVVPGNTTLFPGNIYVRTFRCVCDGNLALSDEFTLAKLADGATGATGAAGKPGADAYTVLLTNEAHTVACDASGNPLSGEVAKAVTKVIAYKGVTAVAFTIQNLVQEGGAFAVDGTDGVKCTSLSLDSATCTFEVNVGGIIIKKVFGVTKSKTGATGKDGKPGAAGKGVTSIAEQYYLSTSSTTQTGGSWVTTPPAWVDGRYFWTQSVITYTDGSKSTTPPVCVSGGKGSAGGTGATGNGISKVDVLYYLSTSATALSGGTWETTAPTWEDGKYMWSKTKVTYTNGTVVESAAACITGGTGATGRGISSTAVTYQASTSGTTVPAGTWSTAIPSVGAGQFLWTRTIITYTDSTNSTSYSVGKIGETGTPGASGRGIKSTAITYQASASGTTVPTGTWSTTIPSVAANQYLWTRTIITYTDNTTSVSYSIGKMGATGATGAAGKGVASVVPQYYLSTSSTTTTGGSWSNTIPAWTNGKYIWTRLVTTYTDNSTTTTSPVYDIANKAVEVAYSKVEAGINNLANGIKIFAKEDAFNALGTRVSTAEATIKTNASNINLKVSKDNIIGQINLSNENATIKVSKIDLVGKVTFSMLDGSAQSTINGKITSAQATSIASGQVTTLRNSLKSLAYKDTVLQAMTDESIIQGGYIKTSLIKVTDIFADNAFINAIQGGTFTFVRGKMGGWVVSSGGLTNDTFSSYLILRSGSGNDARMAAIGNMDDDINSVDRVAIFSYKSTSNTARCIMLRTSCIFTSEWSRPGGIPYRYSIMNDGNFFSVGGHAVFSNTYIGAANNSYIMDDLIRRTHVFIFNSIPSSLTTIYLPKPATLDSALSHLSYVGRGGVTFEITILVRWLGSSNRIRVQGFDGAKIMNYNNTVPGSGYGYIDLAQCNSLVLRYVDNIFYVIKLNK